MKLFIFCICLIIFSSCSNGGFEQKNDSKKVFNKELKSKYNIEEDFKSFISKFNIDKKFQLSRVILPLESITLQDPVDDIYDTLFLSKNEYDIIKFTSQNSNIIDEEIELTYKFSNDNTATIVVKQVDTGVHIEYFFDRQKDDWFLIKIVDQST